MLDINQRFEDVIKGRKKFNGKSFEHWESLAEEHVIEAVVRAALHNSDPRSLIGYIAAKRLMEIAEKRNPTILGTVLAQRDLCIRGFHRIMRSIQP